MQQPTRLFDFIAYQQAHFPQERAFAFRHNGRETAVYSTAQVIDLAYKAAQGLLKLGVQRGDTIGTIIVKNRPEWTILDIGMMLIGAINVPVYPTIATSDYAYIFQEAAVKLCFIGDDANSSVLKKVQAAQPEIPSLSGIYTFDKTENIGFWEDIFTDTEGGRAEVDRIKDSIQPDDLATIIYTSGTTGHPKGVMLSHDNIASNVRCVVPIMPMQAGQTSLSFLPLNHIFERVCAYAYTFLGANVVFTGTDNLGGDEGDLKAVQPHFFTSVPRLLEKVYEKIYNKGLELKGAKRALFFWALSLTNDYEYDKTYSGLAAIKMKIADKLIFSKWRAALGGRVQGIVVGASACPVKIARTFSAAGVPVREGYGMTETSPGISISRFEKGMAKLGCVGPILEGVEVRIDTSDGTYAPGEGEVLSAGPNTMMGYYKRPDETEKVIKIIDGKRFMCTGDIGKLEVHGGIPMLKITDRKKELFKTSGGKYVAPAPIENKFREHFLIEQIMVLGENQKFVSAIITPALEALKDWCGQHNVPFDNMADVVKHPAVLEKYNEILEKYNPQFAKVEQIKAFHLVADAWEPTKTDGSAAELTPTMKLKRRVILEKYADLIAGIYA